MKIWQVLVIAVALLFAGCASQASAPYVPPQKNSTGGASNATPAAPVNQPPTNPSGGLIQHQNASNQSQKKGSPLLVINPLSGNTPSSGSNLISGHQTGSSQQPSSPPSPPSTGQNSNIQPVPGQQPTPTPLPNPVPQPLSNNSTQNPQPQPNPSPSPSPQPNPQPTANGFTDDFSTYGSISGNCLPDGATFGAWKDEFGGYGCVKIDGNSVRETPKASTLLGETHAALVAGPSFMGPLSFEADIFTNGQLRTGSTPNPWEAGWLLWDYTDQTHFYYFIAKTNGWELGKEDPGYQGSQRYLATGSNPSFPIGSTYDVKITEDSSNTIKAYVNGQLITTFTDTEEPYISGQIALYDEDADVHFTDVRVTQP